MKRTATLLIFLISPLVIFALEKHPVQPGPSVQAPSVESTNSGDVEITGGLSQSMVRAGDTLRFWLTIRNRTADTIRDVRLIPTGLSGYSLESRCWCSEEGTPCFSSPSPDCDVIVPELGAGRTVAVWGELRSGQRQEKRVLCPAVRWDNPVQGSMQLVVPMGEITAENRLDSLAKGASWAMGLLKDLALPILLAFLAYRFKSWEDQREADRLKRDKEREQIRHDEETERQHLLQTWNLMLPVSHDDATGHYMPLAAAAKIALDAFQKCRVALDTTKVNPESCVHSKQAFYSLLLLWRRGRRLADLRGGFYLKDRVGEALLSDCWDKLRYLYLQRDPSWREAISNVLDNVDPNERLGGFLAKFTHYPEGGAASELVQKLFQQAFKQFCDWMVTDEFVESIRVLKTFRALLKYEMNRPYLYWYPKNQKEQFHADDEVKNMLRQLAKEHSQEPDAEGFVEEAEEYLVRGTYESKPKGQSALP